MNVCGANFLSFLGAYRYVRMRVCGDSLVFVRWLNGRKGVVRKESVDYIQSYDDSAQSKNVRTLSRSEIYLISLTGWAKNSPSNVRLLLYCTATIIKHGHAEKTIHIKWIAKIRGLDKRSNSSINK
jgi:hypothetical protein